MSRIRTFKDLDEMFAFIEEQGHELQQAMADHPVKVADLRHGDFFVSVRPDFGVVIFGEVVEKTDYPEDDESIAQARTRGWVFARCYSPMCVEGEFGDTHVTNIHAKITKAVFERAQVNGFRHLNPSN